MMQLMQSRFSGTGKLQLENVDRRRLHRNDRVYAARPSTKRTPPPAAQSVPFHSLETSSFKAGPTNRNTVRTDRR